MRVEGDNSQVIIAGRDVNIRSLSKKDIKAIAKAVCEELTKKDFFLHVQSREDHELADFLKKELSDIAA